MSQSPPQTGPSAQEVERQRQQQRLDGRMRRIGRKLLVLSGKGGVGKSTVAASLAVSLAAAGKTVGLLDIDVHGPSIPKLMGLDGRRLVSNEQALLPLEVGQRVKVVSIGLLLSGADEAVIWRGPRKFHLIRQFLSDVEWGRLDYLVVDSPPGTGDEPLTIAQSVPPPAQAVVVTTPQELAISDVRRCLRFCRAVSLPVAGIIENMSGFVCPRCGQKIDIFKSGGGEALARKSGVPVLGRIPIDPEVVALGDEGKLPAPAWAQTAAGQAFGQVAARLLETEAPRREQQPQDETS